MHLHHILYTLSILDSQLVRLYPLRAVRQGLGSGWQAIFIGSSPVQLTISSSLASAKVKISWPLSTLYPLVYRKWPKDYRKGFLSPSLYASNYSWKPSSLEWEEVNPANIRLIIFQPFVIVTILSRRRAKQFSTQENSTIHYTNDIRSHKRSYNSHH